MIILTIRTDKPEAEIGLYDDGKRLAYEAWQAHRQLAESLHGKIRDLLNNQNKQLQDIQAVACFQGPGSFTGLRIGLSVGNALAYALQVPIVASMDGPDGQDWREIAIKRLMAGESDPAAVPEYGAEANITRPANWTAPNSDTPKD